MADRLFHRIVRTNPPTLDDFLSNQARGLPQRENESADIWSGLSHYDTVELARRTALRYPQIGQFIATIHVTEDAQFKIEQTFRSGHYTIWGEPALLLAAVVFVQPVKWP